MRGVIALTALTSLLLAGGQVLAAEPVATKDGVRPREAAAQSCANRVPRAEATDSTGEFVDPDVALRGGRAEGPRLPLYVPPSRGAAKVRTGGATRGGSPAS